MILKNGTPLPKSRIIKRNFFTSLNQRTQNVKQALNTRSDHNMFRRTNHISVVLQISAQNLPQIVFSLRFSIREQTLILPQCTFDIPPPQFKPEGFSVNTCRRKIVKHRLLFFLSGTFLKFCRFSRPADVRHIKSALRPGNNIALCRKHHVCRLHRCPAHLQFCRTPPDRRQPASRCKLLRQNKLFVIIIYPHIAVNRLIVKFRFHRSHSWNFKNVKVKCLFLQEKTDF